MPGEGATQSMVSESRMSAPVKYDLSSAPRIRDHTGFSPCYYALETVEEVM